MGQNMYRYQFGFSLIELLITMGISTVFIALIFTVFIRNFQQYQLQQQKQNMQTEVNTLLTLLREQIHLAGQVGCRKLSNDFRVTGVKALTLNNKIEVNANSLVVRYQQTPTNSLTADMQNHNEIVTNTNILLHPNNVIIIADCNYAETAIIKKVLANKTSQKIILSQPLSHHYQQFAEVGRFAENNFVVINRLPTSKTYSLYLIDNTQKRYELMSGIDTLTFKFVKQKQLVQIILKIHEVIWDASVKVGDI